MSRRPLLVALLWPSALVVLVGVLAFFQYQWLGQVSDADRDRQRTTLNQRAREFATDFDREIGRIYNAMHLDPAAEPAAGAGNDAAGAALAKRYADWKESSPFPQLVKGIYLTDEAPPPLDDAPPFLSKLDPVTRAFVSADWPASLAPVRERLTAVRHKFTAPASPFSSSGNATFTFVSVGQSPVLVAVPALLIPVQAVKHFGAGNAKDVIHFDVEPRYVIVELDKQVLTDVVIPALVEKHLAADDYHVEVLEPHAGASSTAVYRKGLAPDTNLNPSTADATTTFFNVRMDNVALSASNRMSIVVADASGIKGAQDLKLTTERQAIEALNRTALGRGSAGGGAGSATLTYGPGAWQLVLQHPAGSLDAAVAKARRRNLAISFGVLAVLSVSVFMISINAQRSKALAAQQMDFVATVSHELRTPIAVIRSAAQNLSAGVIHDEARAKKYGELIDTEGRRLTDMVEEVLEFSGISGGKRQFAMAPADIGRLTADVMESCGALIREAGVTADVAIAPGLPSVSLDEPAYRRALTNLVSNALKYAADGKHLAVTVFETPDKHVAVTVADKGRGIDPKDVPHIFDAFYRGAYAKERQIHGNGLGLSLVQRIVDAHGGSVSVQTSPAGSIFTMKFHEEQ